MSLLRIQSISYVGAAMPLKTAFGERQIDPVGSRMTYFHASGAENGGMLRVRSQLEVSDLSGERSDSKRRSRRRFLPSNRSFICLVSSNSFYGFVLSLPAHTTASRALPFLASEFTHPIAQGPETMLVRAPVRRDVLASTEAEREKDQPPNYTTAPATSQGFDEPELRGATRTER